MRRLVNLTLATLGLLLFVYLVQRTGVTMAEVRRVGWQTLLLIGLVQLGMIALDTLAWSEAVAHLRRPPFVPLLGLRIAGDSLMSGIPGGVVLSETYKAVKMRDWFGVSLADNAASLVTVRLGVGLSQAAFVLIGMIFAYPLLATRGEAVLGFGGSQVIALSLTVLMALGLAIPLALLARGRSLGGLARALGRLPSPGLRRFLDAASERIARIDQASARIFRSNSRRLLRVFLYLLAGWLLTALESYVLLAALGLQPSWPEALVIEAVGSIFRLVFFFVPAGIGGQDASHILLFRLYNLPSADAGVFVLIKRAREAFFIGLGFLLIGAFRWSSARKGA